MIPTQDLMEGNYVLYELVAWKVVGLGEEGIKLGDARVPVPFWTTHADILGITLSPPILENLGWTRDPVPNGLRFNDPAYQGHFVLMPYVKWWSHDFKKYPFDIKKGDVTFFDGHAFRSLQYLHELQNMYRWTQGKALVIPW